MKHQPLDKHAVGPNTERGLPFSWRYDGGAVALLLLAIVAMILPLFSVEFWEGHEELFPALRTHYMADGWRTTGRLHIPWLADPAFGYGWPFFTFYAPLSYYISTALYLLLPITAAFATALSFHLSLITGGVLMYGLSRTLICRYAPSITEHREVALWALVSSCLFTFAPYHLTDIFMRTSLAQSWSWAACVGYLWTLEYARRRPLIGMLLIALSYNALMLSHNVIALYGTIFFAIYILATCGRNWRWVQAAGFGGFWGALLSAYFWLPALVLLPLVRAGKSGMMINTPALLSRNALHWQQFLMETPGGEFSTGVLETSLGINPGYAVMLMFALATMVLFRKRPVGVATAPDTSDHNSPADAVNKWLLGTMLGLAALSAFIISPAMPWAHIPEILHFVQFPWRIVLFLVFFVSLAVPLAAPVLRRWIHPGVMVGLIIMIGAPSIVPRIKSLYHTIPAEQLVRWGDKMELEKGNIIGCVQRDYLPLTARASFISPTFRQVEVIPPARIEVPDEATGFVLDKFGNAGPTYLYDYTAEQETEVTLHLFAFPGWELHIDGEATPERLSENRDGLLQVSLPAGSHSAEVRYTISPIGLLAMRITKGAWLLFAVALIGLLFMARRKDDSKKN